MKKLVTAALAAAALAGLVACTPQLSTSETCVELQALTSNFDSDASKEDQMELVEEMKSLSKRASDTLKDEIFDGADVVEERLKDNPNQAKISELESRLENGRISETCF